MIDLTTHVAVVTGGSRGIGAAISRMLAKAGAKVVINFIRGEQAANELAREIDPTATNVATYQCDVSLPGKAKDLIDFTVQKFGRIDIIVGNAGIWTYGEMGAFPDDVWDETMSVNLKGTFNVVNSVVPYMKQHGGGRIIIISSTAGQRGEAFHSHYAASKGGQLAFARSLAIELASHKILVNSVAPGWVDTDLNAEHFSDPETKSRIAQSIPLGRIATAEDVAGAVIFLASDLAKHITGATINVNGGSVLV